MNKMKAVFIECVCVCVCGRTKRGRYVSNVSDYTLARMTQKSIILSRAVDTTGKHNESSRRNSLDERWREKWVAHFSCFVVIRLYVALKNMMLVMKMRPSKKKVIPLARVLLPNHIFLFTAFIKISMSYRK